MFTKTVLIVVSFLVLAGMFSACGKSASGPEPVSGPQLTDLSGDYLGQTPPGATPIRFAPNDLFTANSTWFYHGSPVFSPDGNEVYFVKYFSATNITEIWFSRSIEGQWTVPQKASFSQGDFVNNPAFSTSNDTLYFKSNMNGHFIFKVTRTATGWSEPEGLDITLPPNSSNGHGFSITADQTIYFEVWENSANESDIFRTRFVDGQYTTPVNLGATINTSVDEGVGYVDPQERFLIYVSPKTGGVGMHDMYISYRNNDDTWTTPVNLGSVINTTWEDGFPMITPDGNYFFFTTIKAGDSGYTPYWVDASILESLR